MRFDAACLGIVLAATASTGAALAQSDLGPDVPAGEIVSAPRLINPAVPVDATSSHDDPGELVTLYGARRFGALYEPGRPPPTDPITGWPLDWFAGPFLPVGGFANARGYGYSPYGYGYYRSFYRPWYVPYGYGYGWGYRYPFGYYPWYAFRYDYLRPWYGLYRPWYGYGPHVGHLPYVDHAHTPWDGGSVVLSPSEYGGCFYW